MFTACQICLIRSAENDIIQCKSFIFISSPTRSTLSRSLLLLWASFVSLSSEPMGPYRTHAPWANSRSKNSEEAVHCRSLTSSLLGFILVAATRSCATTAKSSLFIPMESRWSTVAKAGDTRLEVDGTEDSFCRVCAKSKEVTVTKRLMSCGVLFAFLPARYLHVFQRPSSPGGFPILNGGPEPMS